jgi:DNA-directed RNA polymerase specialized sigma24 family protein
LEELMATELHVTEPLTGLVRRRNQRAPWRRDTWTPEEVALALHARRAALRRELGRLPAARGVASFTLDEIVDDAACVVVMKLRQIRDEEHLRRAFWLSVNLLLARHHEGRGHLRVGSRERADFESVKQTAASEEPTVAQVIELKERLARAADYVAQLNDLEGRVTAHMAIRGVGIKLAARELGLPLNTVKAAAHSAETKLEQVAAIAAAGGMCAYREPAILAHASRVARPEQVRVAQAHISACSRCQRSYVQLVREMRRREFQRQATAAFLPPPMLVAAHTGVLPRVVAFLSTHAPGNVSPGNFGVRERALGLIGSGAGAAKAAGLLAGATLIVVGASTVPSGAPRSYRLHHRATSVRHTERRVAALARGEAAAPEARAVPSETSPARSTRPTLRTGGFSYLGGNAATRSQHSSAIAASPGKAASLNYLGGNRRAPAATARTASAAAPSSSSTSTASKGGQFSP